MPYLRNFSSVCDEDHMLVLWDLLQFSSCAILVKKSAFCGELLF
jgi:hypothetical protein